MGSRGRRICRLQNEIQDSQGYTKNPDSNKTQKIRIAVLVIVKASFRGSELECCGVGRLSGEQVKKSFSNLVN